MYIPLTLSVRRPELAGYMRLVRVLQLEIATRKAMNKSYESIDLVTRLYCLELLSSFYWDDADYYPSHLIFLGIIPLSAHYRLAYISREE